MRHSSKSVQLRSCVYKYARENEHVNRYCTQMSSIGERLRAERDRLGLNQGAFGEIGGVNRNTQANYEKDDRSPDATYLAAVAAAGVDVLYVLTGQRTPQAEQALSVREQSVVYNFRVLSEADKAAMQRLSDALAQSPDGDVKEG